MVRAEDRGIIPKPVVSAYEPCTDRKVSITPGDMTTQIPAGKTGNFLTAYSATCLRRAGERAPTCLFGTSLLPRKARRQPAVAPRTPCVRDVFSRCQRTSWSGWARTLPVGAVRWFSPFSVLLARRRSSSRRRGATTLVARVGLRQASDTLFCPHARLGLLLGMRPAVCPKPRQLALICAPFWELHRDRARRRARFAQADSERETAWKGADGGARTRVERSCCSPRWAPHRDYRRSGGAGLFSPRIESSRVGHRICPCPRWGQTLQFKPLTGSPRGVGTHGQQERSASWEFAIGLSHLVYL